MNKKQWPGVVWMDRLGEDIIVPRTIAVDSKCNGKITLDSERGPSLVTSMIAYPLFSLQRAVCGCLVWHRTFPTAVFLPFQRCSQYLIVTGNMLLIYIALDHTAEEWILRGGWQDLLLDSDTGCAVVWSVSQYTDMALTFV